MSDLLAFKLRVADHLDVAVASVGCDATCADVVSAMRSTPASHVVVVDAGHRPAGIVTEQDVSRRIALSAEPEAAVSGVMSAPVHVIHAGERLFHAIARMRRLGLRHLPAVDAAGRLVGMLSLEGALGAGASDLISRADRLSPRPDAEGHGAVRAAQAEVAGELLREGLSATEVQALISRINADIHEAVVAAAHACTEAKLGAAPVGYDFVIMGSAGRGESLLHPDQDNGLVLDDYPVSRHDDIDEWFRAFAQTAIDGLATAGFPHCPGYVMATNPVWRKSLTQWRAQTATWVARAEAMSIRHCDIFFDFAAVSGAGALSAALREHVTHIASDRFFLREMFRVDEAHGVALGLFGRLQTDPIPGPNHGQVNLKLTGTLPLVGAVRILALRERIPEAGTLARLDCLARSGAIDHDEHDYLTAAYRHVVGLLLRAQLDDAAAGRVPGNHVPPGSLTTREKDRLVNAFRAIRRFRDRVRTELTADIF